MGQKLPPGPAPSRPDPGGRHLDPPDLLARAEPRQVRQAVHRPVPVHAAVRDHLRPRAGEGGLHGAARRPDAGRGGAGPRAARRHATRCSCSTAMPHMAQRKLMLPAFHGERMERLTGIVDAVTEARDRGAGAGRPIELHPRFQALTLEIILRAVFGLEPGPRLDALRDGLAEMLAVRRQPAQPVAAEAGAACSRERSSTRSGRSRASSTPRRGRRAPLRADRRAPRAQATRIATTCSRCSSPPATRTARR